MEVRRETHPFGRDGAVRSLIEGKGEHVFFLFCEYACRLLSKRRCELDVGGENLVGE